MTNEDLPSDPATVGVEPPLIILVEDNQRFAGHMQASLEAEGFQVLRTRSGAETIKTARTTSPALLVLDYTLPDMSARDIIDDLAAGGFDYPFIIVTGQDSTSMAVEMMKLGARDYLLKNSAAAEKLPEVVRRTLDQIDRENKIHQARQELGREEEMLNTAFEYSTIGTVITKADGRIQRVNEAFSQMLKLSEADILGASLLSFIHSEDRGRCRRALDDMNSGKRDEYQLEARLIDKTGRTIWIHKTCSMVRSAGGAPKYIAVHLQDISQRKQAEEELQAGREVALAFLEAMPLGVFALTADGKPHFANQQAIDLLGRGIIDTDVDNQAQTYAAFLKGTDNPYPADRVPIVRALAGERCTVDDMEIERLDGRIQLEVWGAPVYDNQGKIKYAIATFADITLRTLMESELRRDQKLKALGTMAGGISHDFNNILFTMLGFTALAKEKTMKKTDAYKYLLRIEDAGARAAELVKQVLNFGQPPRSEQKLIRIQPVIEETLNLLQGSIPPGIGIIKNIGRNCSPIQADFTQVHQVLMNIMTNAIQAMKRLGGILQIDLEEVEIEESGSSGNENLKPGRYVLVTIRDTGHGMDPAILEHIFEPYFTTKGVGEGTGLGLSTVYGIVTALGGGIRVNSKPNEGTRFDVYLPVQPEQRVSQSRPDRLAAERNYRGLA